MTYPDSEVWGEGGEPQVSVVGVGWSASEVFLGKDTEAGLKCNCSLTANLDLSGRALEM